MYQQQRHEVQVLSNLQPETVAGLEGVSFRVRALAMPGVERVEDKIEEISLSQSGEEDVLIDVAREMRLEPDTEHRMVVLEKFIVAAGLCYDLDAASSNPLTEGCGNGDIYHLGRRARRGEEGEFLNALGLDGDGKPDLCHDAVSTILARDVCEAISKDRSVMGTLGNLLRAQGQSASWNNVRKNVTEAICREGWEYALDYIAERFFDTSWWCDVDEKWKDKLDPLVCAIGESEAQAAWREGVIKGHIGNPLAVALDIYEHSGVVYSVSGTGMQCQWDISHGGAVWVPDRHAEENIRYNVLRDLCAGQVKLFGACGSESDPLNARYSLDEGKTWVGNYDTWAQATQAMFEASGVEIAPADLMRGQRAEAQRYCHGVLEQYNAWRNGEVYGVVCYVIDRESGKRIAQEDDECWGYVGSSYAEETLDAAVLDTVFRLGTVKH